jgi:hypothetical protein
VGNESRTSFARLHRRDPHALDPAEILHGFAIVSGVEAPIRERAASLEPLAFVGRWYYCGKLIAKAG